MKSKSLLHRMLFPVLIVIIVFPIAACAVFNYTAKQYAVNKAETELSALQELMLPFVNEYFAEDSELTPKERVAQFVRNAVPAARRMDGMTGDSRVMLFAGNYKTVYPRDEEEKLIVEPLAKACREYIEGCRDEEPDEVIRLDAEDGRTYLTRISKVPNDTKEIKYLISYCPVSDIGVWVGAATVRVMLISLTAAAVITALLIYTAKDVNRAVCELCGETAKIGEGTFAELKKSYGINELEQLKNALNLMSGKLKEAEESKHRFYQNISHDLRTPLMSISGYAQGIETGTFEDTMHAAHIISEESQRLNSLIEGLLNLSKISDTDTDNSKPVNLRDALADIYDHMNGLAVKNHKRLIFDIKENVGAVYANEDAIDQIVCNILSNGLRYAENEVRLIAENAAGDDSDAAVTQHPYNHNANIQYPYGNNAGGKSMEELKVSKVIIRIIDDGPGIQESELPYIFERHYKGETGCFGFGLAIAMARAKSIGAKLTAENLSGKGACFTVIMEPRSAI